MKILLSLSFSIFIQTVYSQSDTAEMIRVLKDTEQIEKRKGIEIGYRKYLYHIRSKAFFDLGDFSAALININNALRLDSIECNSIIIGDSIAIPATGILLKFDDNDNPSIHEYLCKDSIEHLFHRIKVWIANKQFDRAIQDYNRVLRLDPANEEALGGRAFLELRIGDYRRSYTDFDRLVNTNGSTKYINHRGESSMFLGNYQKALADFNRIIEVDADPLFLLNRSLLFVLMQKYDKAENDLEKLKKYKESIPLFGLIHGILLIKLGQKLEGCQEITRATEKVPLDDINGFYLALIKDCID